MSEFNMLCQQFTVTMFLFFGYLFDVLFTTDLDFLFDPNADVSTNIEMMRFRT